VVQSIILKKQDLGEADELVVFLSRDLGWLSGVAKNAKRSRVRFGGHLEQLALVDLVLRSRKRDSLVWIDDAQVTRGFLGIRANIARVARAMYFLELTGAFLPEGLPDTEIFDFLVEFLAALEDSDPRSVRFVLDEIRLLGLLGYAPRFDVCPSCGLVLDRGQEAVFSPSKGGACHRSCLDPEEDTTLLLSPDTLAVVRRGLEMEHRKAERLKLGKKSREEIRKALSAFVRYLRGADISSLAFLEGMAP
jgi:DNA repair protein RecO (recombination protein O)